MSECRACTREEIMEARGPVAAISECFACKQEAARPGRLIRTGTPHTCGAELAPDHASDCSVHNMPASPNGPCDCRPAVPKWEPCKHDVPCGGVESKAMSVDEAAEELRPMIFSPHHSAEARAILESVWQHGRPDIRPSVLYFALAMETELRKHDKGRGERGWDGDDPLGLLNRLQEEVEELQEAIVDDGNIKSEAADVGNFAMMIMDVTR